MGGLYCSRGLTDRHSLTVTNPCHRRHCAGVHRCTVQCTDSTDSTDWTVLVANSPSDMKFNHQTLVRQLKTEAPPSITNRPGCQDANPCSDIGHREGKETTKRCEPPQHRRYSTSPRNLHYARAMKRLSMAAAQPMELAFRPHAPRVGDRTKNSPTTGHHRREGSHVDRRNRLDDDHQLEPSRDDDDDDHDDVNEYFGICAAVPDKLHDSVRCSNMRTHSIMPARAVFILRRTHACSVLRVPYS